MSVRIIDKTPQVNQDIKTKASIALRLIASAIIVESTPKTPKRRGDLRQNVLKQVLGLTGKVAWNQDYAIFQESKQFKRYTTAGTGPHFAENAVAKVVEEAAKYFRQAGIQ